MTSSSPAACTWTRLPDDPTSPLVVLDRVRFRVGCNGQTARSIKPIHPDDCPFCGKPIKAVKS